MPELPEMEAWRRALDGPVSAFPIEKAGPGHIATLKTFEPPLEVLEGRRLAGAKRRAKRLLFPTEDGELVLLVHLMTAGRLRYLLPGEKRPKTPAFRLRFQGGAELMLTEAGKKKRAGVWLLTPEAAEAELAHLGPEANELDAEQLGEILAGESRRLHSLLRDQRVIAGIGRAWANEILHVAKLSPYALSKDLKPDEVKRLNEAIQSELARGLELRERGANDKRTYRVHNKLAEPCFVCGAPIARVDFEEHTIYYCPECQTGGRVEDRQTPSGLGLGLPAPDAGPARTSTSASRAGSWALTRAGAIVPSGDTQAGRCSSCSTALEQLDSMARSRSRALDDLGSRAPVVVFANGGDHSYYHDRSDGRWGSYVLDEVIPAAIRKYDLDPRRVAIGGFSMGGFGALDLARFRRFCAVGGHSAAMWRTGGETPQGAFDDAEDFEQNDVIEAAAKNPRLYGNARVWIDVGTEDPFRSADEELARRLAGERFTLWRGEHDISFLEKHADEVLEFYADALERC